MKISISRLACSAFLFCLFFGLIACRKQYQIVSTEGTRIEVNAARPCDTTAILLLAPYKRVVDSIKVPVLGESITAMEPDCPGGLLSNFAADALYEEASRLSDRPVDMALLNIHGMRNSMPEGKVTFGDVYNIFPFENRLCLLTLTGERLTQLFREIASVKGEAVSRQVALVITDEGELVKATLNGRPIEGGKKYRIATLDYLAQGNDKMTALKEGTDLEYPDSATLRDLMIKYIVRKTDEGKKIGSLADGRIITVENRK